MLPLFLFDGLRKRPTLSQSSYFNLKCKRMASHPLEKVLRYHRRMYVIRYT